MAQNHLSQADLDAIECIINKRFESGCICGLKTKAAEEMGHFWGMMEDEGDGEPTKSVERMRSILRKEKRVENVSSKALMTAVAIIITLACYSALDTAKEILKRFMSWCTGGG